MIAPNAEALACFVCESGNANLKKNHFKFRPILLRKKQHMLFEESTNMIKCQWADGKAVDFLLKREFPFGRLYFRVCRFKRIKSKSGYFKSSAKFNYVIRVIDNKLLR